MLTRLAGRWARFLDWLLGPKCDRCRARVFPNDDDRHALDCS